MRIESLQVERFGRFHNFRPEPFGGGLTVLYGRNEAGKSTLLAFVRSVLFGFPTSRSKENRYEPWCGGTVQGTLDLRTRDGVLYRVSRTSGPKGGPVQVFREGRRLEGGQALESLLGPISPEVFRKVFAFSLWELQDLGALNEGEVREALYGAGSGGIRVASVEKVLCDEAQRLFKSGGNAKAPLNQALREIDQREKSLAELRRLPADYDRKVTRVEELTLELTGLAGQAENLLGCRGRVQALLQAWPVQARILDLQAEIAAIPALETFPSEGVSRLESLEAHQDRLNLDLARSRHGLEDLRKRLEACPVDPRILAVTEPIARLQGSRERWEERSHRLPALEERLRSEQETLTREMGDLGTGWNEERVRAQDLSVGLRERLERGRTALAEAETTHREAARRLKEAEEATERCAERVSSGQEALARVRAGDPRLAGLDAASLASAQEAARRLREEVEAVERAGEAAREACAGLPEGWARMRRPGQEELRERWRQLQELQEKAREAGQKVAQATEARDEARERVSRIQRTLEALPHPKLQTEDEVRARREDLRRARHLQGQLRELDLARQAAVTRVQDLVRTGIPVPARLVGVVALVVVGLGIGLVWQRQALAGGVCVFVGLLLGALAWWLRGRRHDESCALEAARADLAQREEALEKARQQALGRPSGQDLERAEAEFADELEKLSRWRAAGESLGQAQDDRTRLQGKVEAAEKLAVQAQQAAKEGREAWDAWCRQQHLPADGPESQAEFLARLDGARSARRQLEAVQERSGRARKALDQARNLLAAPLAELGRKLPEAAPELLDFLVRLAAEAEQARLAIGSAQDLRSRHELDVQALGEARDNNKKAAGACELARQALEAARQAWARLAVGAGLDAGLSPDLALVVLGRLENLQRRLADFERASLDQQTLRQERQAMLDLARDTARQAGMPPCDAAGWVALVDRLAAARDEALENQARREEMERRLLEAEDTTNRLQLELEQVRVRCSDLLKVAGATDGEDFRHRAQLWERLGRLRDEVRQMERSRAALGVEPEELSQTSPMELESRERQVDAELVDLEERRARVAEERTRLRVETERMAAAEETNTLAQELEVHRARARQLARDWAIRTLAGALVGRARQTFERERQPFVLQRAAEHFSRLTGGQYVRVYHPLEEESQLRVETADGVIRVPETLSRGTAEQLYLALRLGFVEDFSRERDPLPLVMDDIFVNFDDQRAGRALEVLGETAERHQVLVFTCHDETVERARKVCPHAQVLDLHEEARAD